jgi:hypothetical protein
MPEFIDDDLSGSHFEGVDLSDTTMRRVYLRRLDLRGALLQNAKLRGVELHNVEISGELDHVVVNGVDIGPLVDQELNRRDPDRTKLHPTDPDGFQEAWNIVSRRWESTIEKARSMPPAALDDSVDGEWSFIQTLRHLNFASAAWVGRMILGDPMPYHPLDLPWNEAPRWPEINLDRDARPALDEVMRVRRQRQAMVADVIADLTPDQLTSTVSQTAPGWPLYEDLAFPECLWVILVEEWEHRNFAERDLDALTSGDRAG